MKVRAKFISEGGKEARVVGYINYKRIREGEIFEIKSEKEFSEKWMERLEGPSEVKKPVPMPPSAAVKNTVPENIGGEEPVI